VGTNPKISQSKKQQETELKTGTQFPADRPERVEESMKRLAMLRDHLYGVFQLNATDSMWRTILLLPKYHFLNTPDLTR